MFRHASSRLLSVLDGSFFRLALKHGLKHRAFSSHAARTFSESTSSYNYETQPSEGSVRSVDCHRLLSVPEDSRVLNGKEFYPLWLSDFKEHSCFEFTRLEVSKNWDDVMKTVAPCNMDDLSFQLPG